MHVTTGVLLNLCFMNNKTDFTSRQATRIYRTAVRTLWAVRRSKQGDSLKMLSQGNNARVYRRGTSGWTSNFNCISDYTCIYTNGDDTVPSMLKLLLFVCFVCPEQTVIISLYSINWLVFVTEIVYLLRATDWTLNKTFHFIRKRIMLMEMVNVVSIGL
jgi:hypothetical protein